MEVAAELVPPAPELAAVAVELLAVEALEAELVPPAPPPEVEALELAPAVPPAPTLEALAVTVPAAVLDASELEVPSASGRASAPASGLLKRSPTSAPHATGESARSARNRAKRAAIRSCMVAPTRDQRPLFPRLLSSAFIAAPRAAPRGAPL